MTFIMPNHWNLLNDFERRLNGSPHVCGADADGDAVWSPAVDILEEHDHVVIIAEVSGVEPKNIEVSTEKGVLTIKGERTSREEQESTRYSRRERRGGAFERSFRLSDAVDIEQISAKCEHGVLEVRLPKKARIQPRSIPVTH